MTRTIHFVRRNPAISVVLFTLPLLAALFIAASFSDTATATHGGPWHTVERASVANDEAELEEFSFIADLSDDGNLVLFHSGSHIYLRDRAAGTTEQIDVNSDEEGANQGSGAVRGAISTDGRYIVFDSSADNLADDNLDGEYEDDTNGYPDVFLRDRVNGTTQRISFGIGGAQTNNNGTGSAAISANGQYVVFLSTATNIVADDDNAARDVFLYDRNEPLGTIERISVNSSEEEADGQSFFATVNADGNIVVFSSDATNLAEDVDENGFHDDDENGARDVFLRDRAAGTTTKVSIGPSGEVGVNSVEGVVEVSADGNIVLFGSDANTLFGGDNGGVFVRNRSNQTTVQANRDDNGNPGTRHDADLPPSLSANGRFVVFTSLDAMVNDDTNGVRDIFIRDLQENNTERVSMRHNGTQTQFSGGFFPSRNPIVSSDGSVVAFYGNADDLVPDDTNETADVFVAERTEPGPQEIKVAVILAEPHGKPHDETSVVEQPCKLKWTSEGGEGPDTYTGYTKAYFEDIAFCVSDYYAENSYGTIEPTFTVYDWLEFPSVLHEGSPDEHSGAESYYVPGNATFARDGEFITDAIEQSEVNTQEYHAVVVVHAGEPTNFDFQQNFRMETADYSVVGVTPHKILVAEQHDSAGVWVHEVGHIIGRELTQHNTFTPDLYNMGLGGRFISLTQDPQEDKWDVMARGSENGDGVNPPHMSSYIKEFLGWLSYGSGIRPKSAFGTYSISAISEKSFGDEVFRYNLEDNADPNTTQYYLLETRNSENVVWDSSIPEDPALVLYLVNTHGHASYGYTEFQGKNDNNNSCRTINIPRGGTLAPPVPLISLGERYTDFYHDITIEAEESSDGPPYAISADIREATLVDKVGEAASNYLGAIFNPHAAVQQSSCPFSAVAVPGKPLTRTSTNNVDAERSPLLAYVDPLPIGSWAAIITPYFAAVSFLLFAIGLKRISRRRLRADGESNILPMLWIIIWGLAFLISLVGFIVLNYTHPVPDVSRGPMHSFLEGSAVPDLDLHFYADDGSHIGMNYETGEYEVEVADAVFSGDLENAPEWIFVPDFVTGHLEVLARDSEEYLANNPDIAAQLEDLTDTYDIYVQYIDASEEEIFTSPVVENITINPGETRVHEIGGTTEEPTVDEGVVMTELVPSDDTYLKKGNPNQNFGSEEILNVRGDGKRRTLVQFDQEAIEEMVGEGELISASLEFEIVDGSTSNWTTEGRLVGAYRLTHAWEEMGATWNCGNDTDTSNGSPNCSGETWEMEENSDPSWLEPPTDEQLITNGLSGTISWDITQDVEAFLDGSGNFGWVLRKAVDTQSGDVEFHSRETSNPPKLILMFER